MKRTSIATIIALLGLLGMSGAWHHLARAKSSAGGEHVIHLIAKTFAYTPNEITLKKGVPVVVEITSLDRDHGFKVPELGVRAEVKPGETTRVRIIPDRIGRFEFLCDVFCGTGHDDMAGAFVVVD
jgi:cytochrome c oxidase subunit II